MDLLIDPGGNLVLWKKIHRDASRALGALGVDSQPSSCTIPAWALGGLQALPLWRHCHPYWPGPLRRTTAGDPTWLALLGRPCFRGEDPRPAGSSTSQASPVASDSPSGWCLTLPTQGTRGHSAFSSVPSSISKPNTESDSQLASASFQLQPPATTSTLSSFLVLCRPFSSLLVPSRTWSYFRPFFFLTHYFCIHLYINVRAPVCFLPPSASTPCPLHLHLHLQFYHVLIFINTRSPNPRDFHKTRLIPLAPGWPRRA